MTTVIVTGIGGSIGIDVIRSLRRDSSLRIVGTDASEWGIRQAGPLVDRALQLPRADQQPEDFFRALSALRDEESAVFLFVNPDPELDALAKLEATFPCATSMPDMATVGITLDKHTTFLRAQRSGAFPTTFPLDPTLGAVSWFENLSPPLWIRSSTGAAPCTSLCVETESEASAWISYWDRRRSRNSWIAQEFLPGINVNHTAIYCRGQRIATTAMERLEYFCGGSTASGVSGQVSRCVTIDPTPYDDLCHAVVVELENTPHGVYSADLRHDRDNQPKVTEVNPRFAGRPWLYTEAGVNLPLVALRALTGQALNDAVAPQGLSVGLQLHRQLDIAPVVGRASPS